jgi:hypothetical protein
MPSSEPGAKLSTERHLGSVEICNLLCDRISALGLIISAKHFWGASPAEARKLGGTAR